jgi:PleD family two-component response regulator
MNSYIESMDALLESADKALYRAKETGRNKIIAG